MIRQAANVTLPSTYTRIAASVRDHGSAPGFDDCGKFADRPTRTGRIAAGAHRNWPASFTTLIRGAAPDIVTALERLQDLTVIGDCCC